MTRIVAITVLFQTTLFGLRPMVSYRALDLGAGPLELGIVVGAFSLLSLFVAIPTGRWVDRHGEAPAIIFGAALMAGASAGLALAPSLAMLALCQALLGSAHVINVVGIQSLLASERTERRRDEGFARFTTAASLGQLLGPAGAGLLAVEVGGAAAATSGATSVFVAGIAASSICTAVALPLLRTRRAAAARPAAGRPATLRQVVALPYMPHAILVSVTVMTSVEILTMYLPAYGEAHGLSVQAVSLLLSVRAFAALLSRVRMGLLVERFGRRILLIGCTVAPALSLCLWPVIDSYPFLITSMVVIGVGLGLSQPLTLSWVAGRVPLSARGAALGLRLSANRFGQMSIPLAVGAVAGSVGLSSIFFSMAALLGLSTAAASRATFGDEQTLRRPREAGDRQDP